AFDGTGYGSDGTIWGGEFLLCTPTTFERFGHLKSISLMGGDRAMREGFKCAYAYLYHAGLEAEIKDDRFALIKAALEHHIQTVQSSSMGRLFDAVSAMLNISHTSRNEGEAAILLENQASSFAEQMTMSVEAYTFIIEPSHTINVFPMLHEMVQDMKSTVAIPLIAYRFHLTVVQMIVTMCMKMKDAFGIKDVALSGGVFQNTLLMTLSVEALRDNDFTVHYNCQVPCNDGGIALGQAYYANFRKD
ncbi:MAG: carbamoyltransferase HypF, partial [Hyphomonadaceae bacterium]|nr:carbamoyltransferase HypF [Clostridia bacterium]